MLGFNHMGRLGQLGNQMFQYASLKGIAANRGYEYMIPIHAETVVDALGNHLRTELFNPFSMKVNTGFMQSEKYVQEPHYEFSEELFNNCPDDVSLWGFFQTEKYFKHIEDDLREDFTFKREYIEPYEEVKDMFDNPIALHVRRGDFIQNYKNHHNLTLDHYENALKEFDDDRQVIIFSDDTNWCKEQEIFSSDRFLACEIGEPYSELYMMSQCTDFIIANSSFSWWGAWLSTNKDKKVIAPQKWFGVNNQDKNTKDLFPKEWLVL